VLWSVIPGILLLAIFAWGFTAFMRMSTPPGNGLNIRVTAQKWSWSFQYPDGTISPNLVVPVHMPVRLTMSSVDVLHSLFIPAFRIKRDAVPNRYTVQWFEATTEGEYQIFCTEYCGTNHSLMLATVRVVSEPAYYEFLRSANGPPEGATPAEWGALLFASNGCVGCHSPADLRLVGPGLGNLWGTTVNLEGGGTATFDDNYIRESITQPLTSVVAGFPPVMPTFSGRLSDAQINALIDYIRTLSPGQ
jgi:cytochrome c oxidase subunit 2